LEQYKRISRIGKKEMTPELKKDLLFAALGFEIGFMSCLFYVSL